MPSSKADKKSTKPASATSGAFEDSTQTDENVITLDRRGSERRSGDPNATDVGVMSTPRRKKQRRRHIDPTTCERDYSDQEVEFMRAMDDYKRQSGRMFPTCSEVLEVIRALGYVQLDDDQKDQLGLDDVEFCDEVIEAVDADGSDEDWEESLDDE